MSGGITWLASYPKSGNTWLRVFLASLREGSAAEPDINRLGTWQLSAREVIDRQLGWESADFSPAELEALRGPVQRALAASAPELPPIKTHEAFALPREGRPRFCPEATRAAIYIVRNPLDVVVSLSHHWGVDFDRAIAVLNDPEARIGATPPEWQLPQVLGDWSTHVTSWADTTAVPVTVLRYEDMLAAPVETFGRAARAVGSDAPVAAIERAIGQTRFDKLQQQEAAKGFQEGAGARSFFREGRSGGWRGKLGARQVAAIVARHESTMRRFGYLEEIHDDFPA